MDCRVILWIRNRWFLVIIILAALEYQDSNLSQIKVNEIIGFMRHVTPKVPSNNHVPVNDQKEQKT